MNANQKQILADAAKVLGELVAAAVTGGAALPVLVADGPTAKDAIERIIEEAPALDAPALDPVERAEVDAEVKAEGDAKLPPQGS